MLKNYIGKEYNTLVETLSKKNKNELLTRTENNLMVFVEGGKYLIGKISKIKVTEIVNSSLKGIFTID